ncbi:MAG: gamma-glutamylcyclotransferase [Erysipelotrichaceae bacterium]|nr:gamma-glutamylcyclotransferase [Erysipelotrichaceae bacterium]
MNQNNDKTRYYLAYGSNLNLRQMQVRCPEAKRVGVGVIKDYRLLFKGYGRYHLTIEPAAGHIVPVGVFEIGPEDERSLDVYEGFPDYYVKKDFDLEVSLDGRKKRLHCFAYVMVEGMKPGRPDASYVETVRRGYRDFGFDTAIIDEALAVIG